MSIITHEDMRNLGEAPQGRRRLGSTPAQEARQRKAHARDNRRAAAQRISQKG